MLLHVVGRLVRAGSLFDIGVKRPNDSMAFVFQQVNEGASDD